MVKYIYSGSVKNMVWKKYLSFHKGCLCILLFIDSYNKNVKDSFVFIVFSTYLFAFMKKRFHKICVPMFLRIRIYEIRVIFFIGDGSI